MIATVFIVVLLVALAISILANMVQSKEFYKMKDEQQGFLNEVDKRFVLLEERKAKELKDAKEKYEHLRLREKTSRAERVMEQIVRELKEEGLGIIKHKASLKIPPHLKKNLNFDVTVECLYASYDDVKDMYRVLVDSESAFVEKYDVKFKYDVFTRYIRRYYNDKEIIKEAIKEKIRKEVAKELIDVLTEEEKPDLDALNNPTIWGGMPGSATQKKSSMPLRPRGVTKLPSKAASSALQKALDNINKRRP